MAILFDDKKVASIEARKIGAGLCHAFYGDKETRKACRDIVDAVKLLRSAVRREREANAAVLSGKLYDLETMGTDSLLKLPGVAERVTGNVTDAKVMRAAREQAKAEQSTESDLLAEAWAEVEALDPSETVEKQRAILRPLIACFFDGAAGLTLPQVDVPGLTKVTRTYGETVAMIVGLRVRKGDILGSVAANVAKPSEVSRRLKQEKVTARQRAAAKAKRTNRRKPRQTA